MQICRESLAGDSSRLVAGSYPLVEAGGQHIRGFRCGLDYAFILKTAIGLADAERVMARLHRAILVAAPKHQPSSAAL